MITPDEAIKALNQMIDSIPKTNTNNDFVFYLGIKEAQAYYDHDQPLLSKRRIAKKGDEFKFRGMKCKVL